MRRGRESRGADEALHPSGRASRGGRRRRALWGKTKPSGGAFFWSRPCSFSRARDAETKTRVSARAAGGGRRGSRVAGARTSAIAAEPPFWEASPGFATPASAWSAIYAWGSAARGGRAPVRPVGYVSIAALAPFSFFSPRRARDERAAGREGEGDGRRVPRARGASRRRVPSVAPPARDPRRAPRGSALEARLASASLGATAEGVGGFASPPILRARASEEPFLPAGPRRAPPPLRALGVPRARLLRVRPRARSRSAGGSSRAPPRVRARRRAMRARAGALFAIVKRPPFLSPRRVVPFRSFTTTGASAGAARGRLSLELLRAVRVSADRRIRKYLVVGPRVVLGYARAHGEAAPTMIRGGARVDRSFPPRGALLLSSARGGATRSAFSLRGGATRVRRCLGSRPPARCRPTPFAASCAPRARSRPRAARTRSSASSFLEGLSARRSTLPDPPPSTRGGSAAPRLPPPRPAAVPPRTRPPGTAPGRRLLGTLPRRTRTSTTIPRRSPRGFAR